MSDGLSQNEIDKLLSQASASEADKDNSKYKYITETEADALGEIGNISMGAAATTLSLLLGNKVDITTPVVIEYTEIKKHLILRKIL